MRRLFLLLILALCAAATLAWLVRQDAGYVLLQFRGLRIETTVWFALAMLLLLLVVFYYAARLLVLVADTASRLGRGTPRAAPRFGRDAAARGAIAWAEGRWDRAARLLAAGARRSGAPLLSYLLAARAASRAGDESLARGFLALAAEAPGAQTAVAVERARLQLAHGEHAAALATLDAIGGELPPAALALLLEVLAAAGEWQRLVDLLPEAYRQELRPRPELDRIAERACVARLALAGKRPDALRAAWDALPAAARQAPALVARHALALQQAGCGDEALKLLDGALGAAWDPALVRALGLVHGADPVKQLGRLEKLLAKHPADAGLLLSLGRIALANRMWAKARDYLDASLARAENAETCAELARAAEHLGDADKARRLRERAVVLALGG